MTEQQYLTADEAAKMLGISMPTLYSYVSRGLLRSEAADGAKRVRRYPAADVQRLKERQQLRREPGAVVDAVLDWGMPILDSALTFIDGGRCYYRGHDSLGLAVEETPERVAALMWTGDMADADTLFALSGAAIPLRCADLQTHLGTARIVERFAILLPVAAAEDPSAYDLRPVQVAQTGARILRLLTAIATGSGSVNGSLASALQQAWSPGNPTVADAIRASLILSADHELNVSSFTVRCVASAEANPYQAVIAGLAALQGVKHGGMCDRVEALMREVGTRDNVRGALTDRLRRGEAIPGFGHRLYPGGDPRGRLLLDLAANAAPGSGEALLAEQVAREAQDILGEGPTIDYGLAALSNALKLPPGSALALFAIGRTIGWIGHAIEQYRTDRLIRPRAQYVGRMPIGINQNEEEQK